MIELVVALGILTAAVLPMAFTIAYEQKVCRWHYYHAVAMEIVDGEMEALAAGEWRAFGNGVHPYSTRANAATNLPSGRFVLNVQDKRLRLEWLPDDPRQAARVSREAIIR